MLKAKLKNDVRIGCVIEHDEVTNRVTVDYGWGITINAPIERFIILPSTTLMSTPTKPFSTENH